MRKTHVMIGAALLSTSLALSGCNTNKNNNAATPAPAQNTNENKPSTTPGKVTGTSFKNFGTYGFDLKNTRHVPYKEVTAANVKDLGVIWSADLKELDKDVKNGNQCYPVFVDGIVYITTAGNQVFAFDGATGSQIWHWKPSAEQAATFSKSGIIANRGVAVGEGKVFMLTVDNQIVSLDQKTGKLIKMVPISESIKGVTLENGYYETTAPVYYKGNIYIGSSGGDNGIRGFVNAYKASDLSPAWASPFYTVPPKGQDWLANSKFQGGGAVWNPPAIDEETGIMYFAVGNPAPDFYGESRPGDNPHTDSVVAVDAATGKLIWAKQEISHDLWDYDAAASPMILNATVKGKQQKIVVQGGKSGQWYAWDAKTGAVVWDGVPFAKIDHPKPTPEGVTVYPGVLGGENYAPETYDPATNYVLIPGVEQGAVIKSAKSQTEASTPDMPGAAAFGTTTSAPAKDVPYGTITAMDVNTGKKAYQIKTKDPMRGGFTSTATGLAFYGELDGKINALDIKNGKVIWTFQTTGSSIQAAPAIFVVDDKQYMAFTSGGPKPKVFVFGLGGDKTQGKAGTAEDTNAHQKK
ncbi:PQQ-binding-like beta-propeller repeat protein [Paenibacillus cellulositrophicus]|uniref:pyrroloquinoline quinone-dependent dehydrogenase n=1 Tax=Paenibacillus cellulositrophicus TaxID=562959 RepID=UPI002040BC5F|nr:PQQ-binding-like beta-propeller repeat protein [Paenibacillus cellulositrophicus]MCM3000601.1 PQQ-binding-like beta-propeller repeat protein [Paenibacillus cellulositrophicus]